MTDCNKVNPGKLQHVGLSGAPVLFEAGARIVTGETLITASSAALTHFVRILYVWCIPWWALQVGAPLSRAHGLCGCEKVIQEGARLCRARRQVAQHL